MGLFDLFKKQDHPSPAKEDLAKAKVYFDNGEYQQCLGALAQGFKSDVNYKALYQLAADSLGKLNAPDEQQLFESVAGNMNNATAFNNMGNFYFSVELYDLAQVFYEKTLQLDPHNDDAVHDLAICFARRFRIKEAVEVLTDSGSNEFWNLYFLNKCKILDQQTDGVQESINSLQSILKDQAGTADLKIPEMKVAELQETLSRYNSVQGIRTHIRDWQFIQYGGVVLDYFEEGEGDQYVAGGRYVASWGSYESIKEIAVRLRQLAGQLSIPLEAVASFPDKDSEITGRLLALELNINFGFYDPANSNQNSLIVAADSSHFQGYEELNSISNGQLLFALNHSWLNSSMVSPDIIGLMSQTFSFPWSGGGMRIADVNSKEIEYIPADERPAEDIAMGIFNLPQEEQANDHDLAFYAAHKDHLKGIGKLSNNNRYNFMIESPVPGSYFN